MSGESQLLLFIFSLTQPRFSLPQIKRNGKDQRQQTLTKRRTILLKFSTVGLTVPKKIATGNLCAIMAVNATKKISVDTHTQNRMMLHINVGHNFNLRVIMEIHARNKTRVHIRILPIGSIHPPAVIIHPLQMVQVCLQHQKTF